MSNPLTIPIQKISFDRLKDCEVELSMARVDQMHHLASGNKIYKINPIIEFAKANNYKQILSFGGAFSNHIHALALMAQKNKIDSIAIIRGEQKYAQNPTLSDAQNAGMTLEFVSREEYKLRDDKEYLAQLQARFPQALIVPEGGSSQLAIQGCAQLARDINKSSESDILAVASGTGTTAAGLVCGLAAKQKLMAYSVLKDDSLKSRIDTFIDAKNMSHENNNYKNIARYEIQKADFGGYAKFDKHLLDFILTWLNQTGILLDPIYTSKLCLRLIQQIEAGEFKQGQSITILHTGGLQGWRGMQGSVESLAGNTAWKQILKII